MSDYLGLIMSVLLVIEIEHLPEGGLKVTPNVNAKGSGHCGCEIAFASAIAKSVMEFANEESGYFPPKKAKENENVH